MCRTSSTPLAGGMRMKQIKLNFPGHTPSFLSGAFRLHWEPPDNLGKSKRKQVVKFLLTPGSNRKVAKPSICFSAQQTDLVQLWSTQSKQHMWRSSQGECLCVAQCCVASPTGLYCSLHLDGCEPKLNTIKVNMTISIYSRVLLGSDINQTQLCESHYQHP